MKTVETAIKLSAACMPGLLESAAYMLAAARVTLVGRRCATSAPDSTLLSSSPWAGLLLMRVGQTAKTSVASVVKCGGLLGSIRAAHEWHGLRYHRTHQWCRCRWSKTSGPHCH